MDKHIYKQQAHKYLEKGYSVIPDKYMSKQPAIKGWADYCFKMPSNEEVKSWISNLKESGIALCLGETSNIVALDLDATDQKVLDIIIPMLPESPVTKIGSKGETRFFRFANEMTQNISFNGEVVLEILSTNKKTTLPPSIHPNGSAYKWKDKSLLDVNINDLPILPPMLLPHVESTLKTVLKDIVVENGFKVVSGRNQALSQECSRLIAERTPVDDAIQQLIKFDKEKHEEPLFSDHTELRHTEPFTNALQFYANHLSTYNSKRFYKNETYEIPVTYSAVTKELADQAAMGKSQQEESQKSENLLSLPSAQGALKSLIQNILDNSWIKQPELAYGAALCFMSTLIARKVQYGGLSPNLYILNLAPSGSGKDAPQQMAKKWLIDLGADKLLGAGDYVSDASLMDSLANRPVRLDIIDEASGLLKSINASKNGYDGKMADILCELYTTSSSKFLGRAMASADGGLSIRGACFRPNVNLLCSTTPAGFSGSVSTQALDKGLLGRFLIFKGQKQKAERLTNFPKLDKKTESICHFWYKYQPEVDSGEQIGQVVQDVTTLKATKEAETKLDEIFEEFDSLRYDAEEDNPMLPIIARLYQQMVKIMIIHSCGRANFEVPVIEIIDVDFAYQMTLYYYNNMKQIVNKYLFNNLTELKTNKVLELLETAGLEGLTSKQLLNKTRQLSRRDRKEIVESLLEANIIIKEAIIKDGNREIIYRKI